MSKFKINKTNPNRCLLTEVTPYETPMIFSNWGAYNYYNKLINGNPPEFLKELMKSKNVTIPFHYQYFKNKNKKRTLTLVHPCNSEKIIGLYKDFDLNILRLCNKSCFSIRYPHTIAKYFTNGRGKRNDLKEIQQFDENTQYASSYFSYMNFSHLHKYFESSSFTSIEKKFIKESHLDISKCFPSIYTHSISWAIRGKDLTKELNFRTDESFGAKFDFIMQAVNYKETNGIVIGPEFSRIFAEIILQEIDKRIENKMKINNLVNGLDYQCVRYLDDYYFYYNNDDVFDVFVEILSYELEEFKLYLNENKNNTKSRPFISDISIKKMSISNYVEDLISRLSEQKQIKIQREINKIREIFNFDNNENHAVTNFFLSILINKMYLFKNEDTDIMFNNFKLLLDISSYIIFLDPRVSSIIKYTKFLLSFLKIIKNLPKNHEAAITDQIFFELCELLKITNSRKASIETLNILITLAELDSNYKIDEDILRNTMKSFIYSKKNNNHKHEYHYFEITTILYYIKNDSEYSNIKDELISSAMKLLQSKSCLNNAENAYLVLDLLSCPYINMNQKKNIFQASIKPTKFNISQNKSTPTISYISKQTWFMNWNNNKNLNNILKKKEYMLSY